MLYPLTFRPRLKERLWGGCWLFTAKGRGMRRTAAALPFGESWDLSGLQGEESRVDRGPLRGNNLRELVEVYMGDLVGDAVFERFGEEFPWLIKTIDTADRLSVQVHPDDELAAERHGCYGKSELWYVLDARPGARLAVGFREGVDREEYLHAVASGRLEELLRWVEPHAGEAFWIPAGTVHTIGAGIRLVEVQQASDVTYRIFDWNRTDSAGRPRTLHTAWAVDALRFDERPRAIMATPQAGHGAEIVRTPHFTVRCVRVDGRYTVPLEDGMAVYYGLEGQLGVEALDASVGMEPYRTVLVPAEAPEVTLTGSGRALEIRM